MRIVQKFGGTSVADIGRLEGVALKIKREVDAGNKVAVVVSAMAGVTNQLVTYTKAIAGATLSDEYDAVASTGEQITTALLALALQQIGIPARSFMGWQVPIITDKNHGNASIQSVNPKALLACWDEGIVPVISGFQGITRGKRITTLGRGGSDTTAVAIAAALEADRCDIYTDVDGVYTADPRLVPLAQKLDQIGYGEMLDLSGMGAKVLHAPCVEMAQRHGINVHVRSSFEDVSGTEIIPQGTDSIPRISGITHSPGWARLNLFSHSPLVPQARFLSQLLAKSRVSVETIESYDVREVSYLSLLIPQASLAFVMTMIDLNSKNKINKRAKFHFCEMILENSLAKIGIIGLNLVSKKGFGDQLLKLINSDQLPLTLVSIAPQKFCLCAAESLAPELVRTLHHQFGLDKKPHATTQYISSSQQIMATRS